MRIGIDCSAAAGERTGIGEYTYNLVRALSRIDKENDYVLYPFFYHLFSRYYKKTDLPDAGNFRIAFKRIPLSAMPLIYVLFRLIPSRLKEYMLGKVDIVHSTTFCAPRFRDKKKKLVETIYDLTVLTHPECHTRENIRHCLAGTKRAIENADAIIAISNHTKQDLINYLHAPEELVTVTHLAADPDFKPVSDDSVLKALKIKYNLPENYILFIGSLEPRKNLKTLMNAYAKLPGKVRKEFNLVMAGAKGWLNSDLPGLIDNLKIADNIHLPGYIDKKDLSAVYSGATVFVYPSLYEGFGLPILEAMACGAPVITSNTSSMPEVAGDAAKLISPTNVDELTAALEYLLRDERSRTRLRQQGLKRAAEFSWEKCARETIDVYKSVI